PGTPETNPDIPALTSRHLAYIIYTSGSTGVPKGVQIEHHSLVNLVLAQISQFAVEKGSRVLQFASPAFDASVWEMMISLTSGAALYCPPDNIRQDRDSLLHYMDHHAVSHALLPPALLQQGGELPAVRSMPTLILGGEAPDATLLRTLAQHGRIYNAYGPTENTVCASLWCYSQTFAGDVVPIGRPVANTRFYVLDTWGQLLPPGAIGELYIGGVGVARGYLNRPELTAERFLPDPFVDNHQARMYRTGDLVRYLPDGNLVFMGRTDHQVKIRGHRIECGEIEARLRELSQVRDALVMALNEGGEKRLVAWVIAEPDIALAGQLRAYLVARLPEYMVPVAFIQVTEWPLTANGKLDRRALPLPDERALARVSYEAPQGELECILAAIWSELLGCEHISRHDSFFALGGHSLLAVRLINRVATLIAAEVALSTLFASPTLASFAQVVNANLSEGGSQLPIISRISRRKALPLSFAQQRLWFLAQLEGVSEAYHIPLAVHLQGSLDIPAWQRALNALFARHEALRSVFVMVNDQPRVRLLPTKRGLPLIQHDLRGCPDAEQQLASLIAEEAHTPFDLSQGPMIRARLIQLEEDAFVFLLTQHHIVSDGWSLGILVSELSTLYAACQAGQPAALPSLTIHYPDYAAWQRQWLSGERLQTQYDHWRTALTEAPEVLTLPTDRPRPAQQSFAGESVPIHLDSDLTRQLKQLSQSQGATLFMTVLAGWAAVLTRLSGQRDIVIGTPVANRTHQDIEPLLGFFVNMLALRLDLSDAPSTAELLSRVRHTVLAGQAHQDLPFEQVVEMLQPARRLAHTPVFQVMFAWQNNEEGEWALPGVEVTPVPLAYDVVKFDLELNLSETSQGIVGNLSYSTGLFDRVTIERQVGYLQAMLWGMVESPQGAVDCIDILTAAERTLLLETWNATECDYPAQQCVHQLFEVRAARRPEATALVYEDQVLSYRELNVRANRLAHQLIALGVVPDQRVALCVQRSPAMMVGLLAILKAGGAYVPLEPDYPQERLTWMLTDASPAIVLADPVGQAALGEAVLTTFTVLNPASQPAPGTSETNPDIPALTSRHLAYIIYTSGSTGAPKGVQIEHHSLVNLALAQISEFAVEANSRVLQFVSPGFDVSIGEMMMSLASGAALYCPPDNIRQDRDSLWHYLEKHAITHTMLPPALLQQGGELPAVHSMPTIILGGEAPGRALLRTLAQHGRVFNAYGPTENTVCASLWCYSQTFAGDVVPIGRPVANTRLYVLDEQGQPVPLGVMGELYIGGVGVARGYLNRPELTAERFLPDPFADTPEARMYRTGDLARYLPDGNLVFMGRTDHQVKIRGYRIECGEIEARLRESPQVRDAVVMSVGEGSEKRLVAWVIAEPDAALAGQLRAHLLSLLPEYMVPVAFIQVVEWPLTPNGKLDRRALPMPDESALARGLYEAPQGELECALAAIWAELLGCERISRHDSFFALGGHSLLAVQMTARLRRVGFSLSVRDLFLSPTLSVQAQRLGPHREVTIPPNVIHTDLTRLTPDHLPLITLTQDEIDALVLQVPGGINTIQDIYALSPLQDGILFHHLLAQAGDPYLLVGQMAFSERAHLDRYLAAVQQVVNRHDILRTAFIHEGLSVPAQVVWRQASLPVTELSFNPDAGPIATQLADRFDPHHYRIPLNQAPLLRFAVARDESGHWLALLMMHHLAGDHSTLEVLQREVQAFLTGQGDNLPPAPPFRNLIAQTRSGCSQEAHSQFFREMLAEVDEPTCPFGLTDVYHDGSQVTEYHQMLPEALNERLRTQARRFEVSVASLCHLAWAQVLACLCGQQRLVFGTVLLGRMQSGEGALQGVGLFINTLPLRLDLNRGNGGVEECIGQTHQRLAALLAHEHAPLVLAQRCSGVATGIPLFSALLNYRHNASREAQGEHSPFDVQWLAGYIRRTNYPFAMSVDDYGDALGLTAQVVNPLSPERIRGYMVQALCSLAQALEETPLLPMSQLTILPEAERRLLLETWNATICDYPAQQCVHQLFESRAARTPEATALVYQDGILSYRELNMRANALAHQLIALGLEPEQRVAVCVQCSPSMVVGLLAILKAGGTYIPLDLSS
ncbi:MAG: amino acid adenylation domain-containing protein, partial [Enterobacteriaceae bacterium]